MTDCPARSFPRRAGKSPLADAESEGVARAPAEAHVRFFLSSFPSSFYERRLSALPNIRSAKKWVRASEKRRKRNLDVKTRLKTIYKRATAEGAPPEAAIAAASAFDKAAARGIIHKNKASRKKSRLAKRTAAKA